MSEYQEQQLHAEIELLLLHLRVPTEEPKKNAISSKKDELLSLKKQLKRLPPPKALSMLNDLLQLASYPYQITFLNDQNTKDTVMNNPAICHLFALVLSFLATPLKKDIQTHAIEQKKNRVIEFTKQKQLTVAQGLEVMALCKEMIEEIVQIVDRCECEAKKKPVSPTS